MSDNPQPVLPAAPLPSTQDDLYSSPSSQSFPPAPQHSVPPQLDRNPQSPGYPQTSGYPQSPYAIDPALAMATPVKVLGICYLVVAALALLIALSVGTLMPYIMAQAAAQNPGTPVLPAGFGVILAVLIAVFGAALPLITGIGLLRRASWGRVLAIITGIFILLSFPFGTILGGTTLYFMFRSGAAEGYRRLSQPQVNPY